MSYNFEDFCNCGSGKKYKDCCSYKIRNILSDDEIIQALEFQNAWREFGNLDIQALIDIGMQNKNLDVQTFIDKVKPNKTHYKEYKHRKKNAIRRCLCPTCSEQTISSHAISKKSTLEKIAEDGHVFCFVRDEKGGCEIKKRGMEQATTFNGFCSTHDNDIFAKIDAHDFDLTDENMFLLAYRTFSSYYRTETEEEKFDNMTYLDSFLKLEMGDLITLKEKFDKCFINKDYSQLCSLKIELPHPIKFAGTATYVPTKDMFGNQIQSLNDKQIHRMFITILPVMQKTYIVLSWFKDSNKIFKKYLQYFSKLTLTMKCRYLSYLIINAHQNLVFHPQMWNKIKQAYGDYFEYIYKVYDSEMQMFTPIRLTEYELVFQRDLNLFQY